MAITQLIFIFKRVCHLHSLLIFT